MQPQPFVRAEENPGSHDPVMVLAGCPVHVESGGTSTQLFVIVLKV